MHHGAYAYGGERFYLCVVVLAHIGAEIGIAILQAIPDGLGAVGPQSVHHLVFPLVAALGYRAVIVVGEDCLYAG